MIHGFSHIVLPVNDVDETIAFYTMNLGFTLLRRYKLGEIESAYIGLDGVLLELFPLREGEEPLPNRWENPIGLEVTDLDSLLAELIGKGIECGPPNDARTFWGRQAKIRDNNGYLV